MNLIGINGFKGSGKDTSYLILRDRVLTGVVQRAAFADKLKQAAASALGFERDLAGAVALMDSMKESAEIQIDYNDPETGLFTIHVLTGREYLQHFGNKHREIFGDSFWVDQVLPLPLARTANDEDGSWTVTKRSNMHNLALRYPGVDTLVVTDVRYENEALRVQQLGGRVIEIVRPGLTSDGHISERPLPRSLVNAAVVNDGSLQDLRVKLTEALA